MGTLPARITIYSAYILNVAEMEKSFCLTSDIVFYIYKVRWPSEKLYDVYLPMVYSIYAYSMFAQGLNFHLVCGTGWVLYIYMLVHRENFLE